jgi:hypothetical protein
MKMKECVLCGAPLEKTDQIYSYNKYLHELDKKDEYKYCKTCNEILRSERSRHVPKNKIIRIKIRRSDYYLPGFVLSKDRTHYIRQKKIRKMQKQVMNSGRF